MTRHHTPGVAAFDHPYSPADVHFGRGAVARLGDLLGEHGIERALVVTGGTVAANEELMGPLRAGLGDRLAGVFDGTTPEKTLSQAYAGLARLRETDADGLVGVGGGSSLDVTTAIGLLAATPEDRETVAARAAEGSLELPAGAEPVPTAVVPTTFAGAELSTGGSVGTPAGRAGMGDRRLMPTLALYDPALVETTPRSVLRGSAMNGFDKGIEVVYGRAASPLTDATAVRGLDHLRRGLVGAGDDPAATEHATLGALLVGYGLSTGGPSKLGPIHAFGHGLSRGWPLQQGVAHAVVAPRVVDAALAAATDDRPLAELATGLGVAADRASVVAAVRELRDALDLPTRLRDTDGPARDELDDVAAAVRADPLVHRGPAGYEPTVARLRDLLVAAW